MSWTAVCCDISGTPIGEIFQASQRALRCPLNGSRTYSFQVRRDNPMAPYLRQCDLTLVKVYDAGTLRFVGPVIGYVKSAQDGGGTYAVNCADVGWRLGKRLIESSKSKSGVSYPANAASGGTVDRGAMVQTIINELNAVVPWPGTTGDTGVRVGTITPSSLTGVGPWYFKNALQALTELSAPLDGFDWQVVATEPTVDATGLCLGLFNCGPVIGQTRPDVVWEYGDGKLNVASFTETTDAGTLLNNAYNLPPGFPDNATQDIFHRLDPAAITAHRAVYEEVVPGDFVVDDMRDRLLIEHVTIRRTARTVIDFTPVRSLDRLQVPLYGSDFVEGDIVRFRAVEERVETVNALMRIYVVEIDIDDEGHATPVVTLLSQDASS